MEEVRRLAEIDELVPSSESNLEACCGCGLILSRIQWEGKSGHAGIQCPNNCYDGNQEITSNFIGMISIMHPKSSWVARWNNKGSYTPGVYAMHLDIDQNYEDEIDE